MSETPAERPWPEQECVICCCRQPAAMDGIYCDACRAMTQDELLDRLAEVLDRADGYRHILESKGIRVSP